MNNSLRQLCSTPAANFSAKKNIAVTASGTLTGDYFLRRISAWERSFKQRDEKYIALYNNDTLEFSASLLALWRCKKIAVVPANNLVDNYLQLETITTCFAGDFFTEEALNAPQTVDKDNLLLETHTPAPEDQAIILFTSGSNGQPAPITKTFAQLDAEINTLEHVWGAQLGRATITSSVSHHHIYGMLYWLLWPLCTGRVFISAKREYWEQIFQDAKLYSPLTIISSPAHLSRLAPLDWQNIADNVSAIFSSGAPLANTNALDVSRTLGQPVTEVYGSTETGGIAWRNQCEDDSWQPFPKVAIAESADGLLRVKSPYLEDDRWADTADKVSLLANGKFHLKGRADRIAKVGGKRISLTALEQLLEAHCCVEQARAVTLDERGGRVGAAIVLTAEGRKQLIDKGKAAVNTALKNTLEKHVDRVAIPRYWRYVGQLPRNTQGKLELADLHNLFVDQPKPRFPKLITERQQDNIVELELFIGSDLYYFDGHFPGRAVLPGVVQTHWAVHYAQKSWGDLGVFSCLEAVKFQRVFGADQKLLLKLEYQRQKNKLYFTYSYEGKPAASGRVVFNEKALA